MFITLYIICKIMPTVNNPNINNKIDKLVHSIELLIDVVEKRGRANRPSSMYYVGTMDTGNNFLRERGNFNSNDFNKTIDEFINELKDKLGGFQKELKETEKIINDTAKFNNLSLKEQNELIDKQTKLKNKANNLGKAINGYENNSNKREKLFSHRHRQEINRKRKEYNSLSSLAKSKYDGEDDYIKSSIRRENYIGSTKNRNEASDMIARSGFGNTAVGGYGQTLIDRQQRIDDISNFADILQHGGAEKISSAIGGGKGLTTMLSGFGKGLGGVMKFLGPFGIGLQLGVDAVKLFAQVVGAANAYITRLVNLQTDLNEMSFQKTVDINNLINERQVEAAKYIGDLHLKQAEIEGQNLLQAVDIITKQFVKATEIAVGPLTKGINESAYSAANAFIDYQADMAKFGLERGQREKQYENFKARRGIEYENFQNINSREEERVVGKYNYDSFIKSLEGVWEAHNNGIGRLADTVTPTNGLELKSLGQQKLPDGSYSDNTASVFKKNPSKVKEIEGLYQNWVLDAMGAGFKEKGVSIAKNLSQPELFGVEWNKQIAQWYANTSNTIAGIQEQAANKQIEISTEVAKKYIDANAEVKKMWLELSQKTEQWLDKFDQVTNDLGVNLGYTSKEKLNAFQDTMFETSKIASKFGKSFEDAAKIQQAFIENTGRNRIMGEHDYGQMFGLGKYLGDDGLASNYASEMEIFNVGVADSVDMLDNVLQDVNRIGLNGRKYTKTLVDSLKLAQKYNFKGGTENLMKMAKWAENTRFNMNSLGGMLDKISEGGLEGVITQGAQFQVLGGHAAMNADPIAMMYERYADPEAFAKRMQDMTKGYGSLDRTTGETKFSGTEQMLMEQLAKIQGRSVEDVMNEVRARNKKEVVSKQLNGNFDEDEQSLISNLATYNKKTGQFQVKVKDKNTNKYVDKDVNQLSKEDLQNLMPEKHDERMEDYMQTVVDYLAKMTGEENLQKTMIGQELSEDRKESYDIRLQKAHQNFIDNFETYVTNAREGMHLANEKFSDYIEMWQNNEQAQGPGLDQINAATSNIASALGDTANVIATANQKIADSIDRAKFGASGVSGYDESPYNTSIYNAGFKIPKPKWMRDGIVRGKNTPIVTKVNDSIIESDPKDVAIFAKEGGTIGKLVADLDEKLNSSNGGTIHLDTINVQISGSLDLSSGGQSVDIINELQNNPILLRALSRMLSEQLSKALNGGRGSLPISVGNV